MLAPLSLVPSFGFGDRLGLATPGHIAAVRGTGFAPVFAQQSVRENARTGRTPQQVLDDARRAVDAADWNDPWGADADHLKTPADLPPFVAAGYTFFTVDPGEHVDNAADMDPPPRLRDKAAGLRSAVGIEPAELVALYVDGSAPEPAWGRFDETSLLRAFVKYGRAIRHAVEMFQRLSELKGEFDFEVSVDETDSPTTPLEHFFIASELHRHGVRFTSLAPRFIGRFEKGVDYLGDLGALAADLSRHAAVTAHFNSYKLSLHSGSDKFSVYPLIAARWGRLIHVKTAGTSYLEALRALAEVEPALFRQILLLGIERYPVERATYHVSAAASQLPIGLEDHELPRLLEDFHARQVLHVTYGAALSRYGVEISAALRAHPGVYIRNLRSHFARHLELLR